MSEFTKISGEGAVLICTDVAARGLNIPEVKPYVLNLHGIVIISFVPGLLHELPCYFLPFCKAIHAKDLSFVRRSS